MLIYRDRLRDYFEYSSGGGGGGGNPLTAVYGANLHNYWSNNLDGATGVYTDDISANNIAFGSVNVPTVTTTAAGQKILNIAPADSGDSSANVTQPPGGTVAMQFGCIFNIQNGTTVATAFPEVDFFIKSSPSVHVYIGAGWGDAVGDNQYIFAWNSAFIPGELLQKNNIGTGYHTCVVDIRSNHQVRLYVDGALFGSVTPATAPVVNTLNAHSILYSGNDTHTEGIGACFVAYKSSDFTLDTDAIAACNALATLFP